MRFILSVLCLSFLLFACEEESVENFPGEMPSDEQMKIVSEQNGMSLDEVREFYENCAREGGKGIIGGFGQPACEKSTPDAGQSCSKESDCEGFCMADTKTCAAQNPLFGCHDILTETGEKVAICVD